MDEKIVLEKDELYDFYNKMSHYLKEFCKDMDIHMPGFKLINYEILKANFDDMYSNHDKRFIMAFKKCFFSSNLNISEVVIRDINNMINEYDKLVFNRYFIRYFVTFYTILKAYEYQKDDFLNFKSILDDVGSIEAGPLIFDFIFIKEWFKDRSRIVDKIIRRDDYKDDKRLKRFLKSLIGSYNTQVHKFCSFLNNIFDDIDSFKDMDNYKRIDIDYLVDLLVYWYQFLYFCPPHEFYDYILYDKILLFGERLGRISHMLRDLNLCFDLRRYEIFFKIKKLNINFFDDLQGESEKDFFLACMNIVFDSDSYHELFSKLNYLIEAGDLYEKGKEVTSSDVIRGLNDSKHKDIYCGKVVCFEGCMNQTKKPMIMFERMRYLYSRIDPSISYDFMSEIFRDSESIDAAYNLLNDRINSEKKWFNRVKSKVMRGFGAK